jgi:hypothetical protein
MCLLLTGNNDVPDNLKTKINKETYSVPYTFKTSTWSICDGELILTSSGEASGSVDNNHITTQVSALRSSAKNAFPYFQLFVNVGCGFGRSPITSGTMMKGKTYDCFTKKWTDDEPNKFELCVNNNRVLEDMTSPQNNDGLIDDYKPPLFDEAELKNFLKEAPGNKFAKAFDLKASEFHKSANSEEQTDINITLIFKGTWQPPEH